MLRVITLCAMVTLSMNTCALELQATTLIKEYDEKTNSVSQEPLCYMYIQQALGNKMPIELCGIIASYIMRWKPGVIVKNDITLFDIPYYIHVSYERPTFDRLTFMDDQFVAGTSSGELQIYNSDPSNRCKLVKKIWAHNKINAVLYHRAANAIISTGRRGWFDSNIKIWKGSGYTHYASLHDPKGDPITLCLFPGNFLISGNENGGLVKHDIETQQRSAMRDVGMQGYGKDQNLARLNDNIMISAHRLGQCCLRLWDVRSANVVQRMESVWGWSDHTDNLAVVDEHRFFKTSFELINLYDVRGGLQRLCKHGSKCDGWPKEIAMFNRNSLLTAAEDGTVKIWGIDKNVEKYSFSPFNKNSRLSALAAHSTRKRFIVSAYDKNASFITLWDAMSKRKKRCD